MTQLRITAIFLMIIVTFNACKKEGPAGPAGKDGNANVISSNTVVLNNWVSLYDDGTDFSYSSTITWSSITQEIRDNGLLMAYLKDNTSSNWYAMPYSFSGDGYSQAFNFDFNTGVVNVTCDGYDVLGSPGASTLNGSLTVRLVAVPATVRLANPDVDWTNYESVRKKFGLAK